jgi:hypothetical protein
MWPVDESPVAVTESWENVQSRVAALSCLAARVVPVGRVDDVGTPVVEVATLVDVVELAECADELHAVRINMNVATPRVAIRRRDMSAFLRQSSMNIARRWSLVTTDASVVTSLFPGAYACFVSISVDVADLKAEISRFGSGAFLVTTSSEGPPHISSVVVILDVDCLTMRIGRRTRSNLVGHPAVSLMWTTGSGDYCLIVDGDAQPGPSDALRVTPTSAVLHRLAAAPNEIAR